MRLPDDHTVTQHQGLGAQETGSWLSRGASGHGARSLSLVWFPLGLLRLGLEVLWGIQILILLSRLGNLREDFGPPEVPLPVQFPPQAPQVCFCPSEHCAEQRGPPAAPCFSVSSSRQGHHPSCSGCQTASAESGPAPSPPPQPPGCCHGNHQEQPGFQSPAMGAAREESGESWMPGTRAHLDICLP